METCVYHPTGAEQAFTVPAGVTSLTITAIGAAGSPSTTDPAASGGEGARVTATVAVTPGSVLYVEVGGISSGGLSGFNGGGPSAVHGGGGGGGASDVQTTRIARDFTLASALLVAGGGGGGGGDGGGGGGSGVNGGGGGAGPTGPGAGLLVSGTGPAAGPRWSRRAARQC